MSDAKTEIKEAIPNTANGRMLSRARRQAMSHSGKAGLGQVRKTEPVRAVAYAAPPSSASDDKQGTSDCGCGHSTEQKPLEAAAVGLSGGRAIARARRAALCLNGRGNDPACRPSGRVRSRSVPVKVEIGTTLSGTPVSGTQVERSSKVTGTESGSCRAVTGTEYIGAEQYEKLCTSTPPAAPAKVSVSNTSRNQRVSGVELGRSVKVTGDEYGACKTVTGTEYLSADQFESFCTTRSPTSPTKVSVMSTVRERPVTGTDIAAGKSVTGSEYGGCQPISGTEYMGPDHYTAFCDTERQAASRALMASRGARAGAVPSGTRIGSGDKVTGVERGEDLVLSGTPYSGPHQRVSQRGANSNPHPLTRGPADAPHETVSTPPQAPMVQGNFSITPPARQNSGLSRITGTASGAQDRITGPVNLATGLVSGTPEFRYRDEIYDPASVKMEQRQVPEAQRSRLTGDGREGGFAITGAAWRRNESITGTEGTSATRRNPTQRGNQRSMAMQVPALKDREHLQVPLSKVTGSSGSSATGSTITYSGGARG
ncbi:CsoS2 family carboxysome shell protein [Ferrovum sp.]|jgi:hypothetical protein|uniref:CsoS2 family carboxysome shell protein n=1 Tax=Ferrovum sp. TaxID=2609467 RepID=UPI00261C2661|nr:CsoS2 family carboxysome shell protein [Ferrovum sp.]